MNKLDELERNVRIAYEQAQRDVEWNYKVFAKEYHEENARKLKEVKAGTLDKKAYKAWLREQTIKEKWFRGMVDAISTVLVNADKLAAEMINGVLPSVLAEASNYAAYLIEHETTIDTAFNLVDRATAEVLLQRNQEFLAGVNETKDKRWQRQKVTSAMTQAVLQGETIDEAAERVRQVTGMAFRAAIRVARTKMTGAENAGRIKSYRNAEKMGIKLEKQWVATLDGRTRHSHRELDGVKIKTDDKFKNGCRFPGDPQAPAAETSNCRCTLIAALADYDYENYERNSKLAGMTYEEWKHGH